MPSADESRNPSTFAFAKIATHGPPWVPRVSPRPHFRHAFTRSHYALGPLAYPAIRWSLRATCRPSTSATETIHEHTNRRCKPRRLMMHRTSGEKFYPLTGRLRRTAGDPEPLAGTSQPSCLRPGVAVSLRIDLCNPHRGDRSPLWIYPNLIDPDTPCREQMPGATWNKRRRTTAR